MRKRLDSVAPRVCIVGIDEVGRGPIAGPITVGAVCIPRTLTWKQVRGLRDSKKLSPTQRVEWYKWVQQQNDIQWSVASVSASRIDTIGIAVAGNEAARAALKKLHVDTRLVEVRLDYGLKVEAIWKQRAIVKGDEREVAIALASIMAKVTRDAYMTRIIKKFPGYDFENHKGYGTKAHYERVKKNGLCTLHRKSFLKRIH